mmetsp:Transcript_26721/g.50864  ORF Transcript_26721/g.50864 Transcript_26721/m.50864 type:complete len:224 (+) Transcript_26721:420-1091(+)
MYSVGPLQLVAITGRPIAMASTCGRPQPSPRDGSTKAPAALYNPGISVVGTCLSISTTRGHSWDLLGWPCDTNSWSKPSLIKRIFLVNWRFVWYALVSRYSATGSVAENSCRKALISTSQPLRASHLNTLKKMKSSGPSMLGPVTVIPRGRSGSARVGSKKCTSTGSGISASFSGSTPLRWNVSRLNREGTHTLFMRLQRRTCSGLRRSVSKVVRPITIKGFL